MSGHEDSTDDSEEIDMSSVDSPLEGLGGDPDQAGDPTPTTEESATSTASGLDASHTTAGETDGSKEDGDTPTSTGPSANEPPIDSLQTYSDGTDIEPEIDGLRAVLGTRPGRDSLNVYLDPNRIDETNDLIDTLADEFNPAPGKTDVYAAIYYAGLPSGPDDIRTILTEFGYHRS